MADSDREFRNPLRNEADAFRVLMRIFVAAAIVIAAAELVGSWLGIAFALVAIAFGIYATVGWLRVGLGEPEEDPPSPSDASAEVRRPEPGAGGAQRP